MTSRRDLLKGGAMATLAGALPRSAAFADSVPEQRKPAAGSFWPAGIRMVISVSMQMEGGAQPSGGAESPIPKIDSKYPDLPAGKWYDYGFKEGLPRPCQSGRSHLRRGFRTVPRGPKPYARGASSYTAGRSTWL